MKKKMHVVLGLGLSGVSALRYLHQQGMPLMAMDSRENLPHFSALKSEFPDVLFCFGRFDSTLLDQAECMVLSPGLPPGLFSEWEEKGIELVSDVELFARAAQGKTIVSVTGTNAKSTVSRLIADMINQTGKRALLGGNFGTPALDLLNENADVYVLELSSFQLETTYSLRSHAACILNVTADHLDRHRDFHEYRMMKQRIFIGAKHAVCSREDRNTHCLAPVDSITYFSLGEPQSDSDFGLISKQHITYLACGKKTFMPVSELSIRGEHHQQNALASLALARALNLNQETCLSLLKTFQGLPHRCQWIRNHKGVDWYNDSKGTNVGASVAALRGLASGMSGKIILIAGGVGKNADFSPLLPWVQRFVRTVIVLGEAKEALHALFNPHVNTVVVNSMEEAVEIASKQAESGDAVLLSPACASLDMFKDYAHRGTVFMNLVQELP